ALLSFPPRTSSLGAGSRERKFAKAPDAQEPDAVLVPVPGHGEARRWALGTDGSVLQARDSVVRIPGAS
ncbi:MAG TPA: hypothetical protein VMF65_19550, partial [Acidimicrobiales bacterium]|nr:hypothetical protein [Acidimicrobiales bacterium]